MILGIVAFLTLFGILATFLLPSMHAVEVRELLSEVDRINATASGSFLRLRLTLMDQIPRRPFFVIRRIGNAVETSLHFHFGKPCFWNHLSDRS